MTLQDALRAHLAATGCSKRALSLEAGLNEKAVADILGGRSARPSATTVAALARVMALDPATLETAAPRSWADALTALENAPPAEWSVEKAKTVPRQLRWFLARMNWVPELRSFDRREALRALNTMTAAEAGLTAGSLSVYRSNIRAGIDAMEGGDRPRGMRDVTGPWRALYDRLESAGHSSYRRLESGAFIAYCHFEGLMPADVDREVFRAYHATREARGDKTAGRLRKHLGSLRGLWNRLAVDPAFAEFDCRAVGPVLPDGRDRFGVENADIAPLLAEFDSRVAPWARGEATPEGLTYAQILAELDAEAAAPPADDRASLRALLGRAPRHRASERSARLQAQGLLTGCSCWNAGTLAVRRGYVVSLAKALKARTGFTIGSIAELTDPEVLEAAATALDESRSDEDDMPSSYVASVLKAAKKIAAEYCRREAKDIAQIAATIAAFETGEDGICMRNKVKLQQFTPARIQAFVDLSAVLVSGVNAGLRQRREAARRQGGPVPPAAELVDADLARQMEVAVAHDIMLSRPLRLSNLKGIRLDDIRFDADARAVIVIPAARVKGRSVRDGDLQVPLSAQKTRLLRRFIKAGRPRLLAPGGDANPYLFPARTSTDAPYSRLGEALVATVHAHVGVLIHPHLYRHLVGWIWLKADPNKLPAVQRLLGHRRIETTLKFYAELDEDLALQEWNDHVESRQNGATA